MKNFFDGLKKYFTDFGTSIAKGDIWVKLSLLIMGAGYMGRGQVAKGILMTILEIAFFVFTFTFSVPYIQKMGGLGDFQYQREFDVVTMGDKVFGVNLVTGEISDTYDNSLLILLYGLVGILVIVAFVALYISNIKTVYRIQMMKEEGEHINTFKEDCKELINGKFYITLLTLPSIGVLLINVIPIIFMVCVAFTNYDQDHQPPAFLFDWVGWENFKNLFTSNQTITFGYSFVRVLAWTLIWAVLATFTTYIGGILLAKFINNENTKAKKLWRTLFVITIAIPQFVTLLLISKMFSDVGIMNGICADIGLTDFLKDIGLVGEGLNGIPFLSKPGWAHMMIILVNIWVGVPYQMLSATGILMNIPEDQLEAARIDGANQMQIFWKITMPYMLFVTGPSLITSLVGNINNFNVIYLLTNGYVTTDMSLANSKAKEVDLLVTWLFTLTNDNSDYKMASVIGICVFAICATLTLLSFTNMIKGDKEEEMQ